MRLEMLEAKEERGYRTEACFSVESKGRGIT